MMQCLVTLEKCIGLTSVSPSDIEGSSGFFLTNMSQICQGQMLIFVTFLQGQQPQDSPKKSVDKGPAPNPPLSGEAQLKYENDRLKLALAQRYANQPFYIYLKLY